MHKLFGGNSATTPKPDAPASSSATAAPSAISDVSNQNRRPQSSAAAPSNSKSAPTIFPTNFLTNINNSVANVKPPTLPRLPPSEDDKNYSLVLDLDETLLHTQLLPGQQGQFIVHERPFVRELLRSLKQLPLEVIVFTAGLQGYADAVLDILDRGTGTIAHRLYRQHTTSLGFQRWKDLSLLSRDLDRVLIVDNSPEVFRYHSRNGLAICPWEGHNPIIKDKEETPGGLLPSASSLPHPPSSIKEVMFEHKNDYALPYLLFWLEYMVTHEIPVPIFIQRFHTDLRRCLSREGASYFPVKFPFQIGPVSAEFAARCLLPVKALYQKPPAMPPLPPKTSQHIAANATANATAISAAAAAVSTAAAAAAAATAAAAVTARTAALDNAAATQNDSASTASAGGASSSRASSRRSSPSSSTAVLSI